MEFERSDPPSALKSRRPQTIDVESVVLGAVSRDSPPPPSRKGDTRSRTPPHWRGGPSPTGIRAGRDRSRVQDGPRAALIMMMLQILLLPIRKNAKHLEGPGPRPWSSPVTAETGTILVVEESSPDSDRSTPQPTIPLEDHLGDLLALPPAQQRARPSETVQLEADLGAMLEAVRPAPPPQEDVTMEDAALDTTQLLASLGLDDASLSKDAPQDVAADDETGRHWRRL